MTRVQSWYPLLLVTCLGCSNAADTVMSESDRQARALTALQERVSQIEIGMPRDTVDQLMSEICTKAGTSYRGEGGGGGSGRWARYYRVEHLQVQVAFEGRPLRVTRIGEIVPTKRWEEYVHIDEPDTTPEAPNFWVRLRRRVGVLPEEQPFRFVAPIYDDYGQ
jgi:hypothetical protein